MQTDNLVENLNSKQLAQHYLQSLNTVFWRKSVGWKPYYSARGARFISFGVRLADSTQLDTVTKLAAPIALQSGVENVNIMPAGHFLDFQFQLQKDYWMEFYRSDVSGSTVGIRAISSKNGNKVVKFEIDKFFPHSLFSGTTRSGKTEAVKTALHALCTTYTPDKLKIGICDPKIVKFSDFQNSAHLVGQIASNKKSIENMIQWFWEQFVDRRNKGLVKSQNPTVPYLLLVLDECHDPSILGDAKAKNRHDENMAALSQLVKQGGEYGIHTIFVTQYPTMDVFGSILKELGGRWIARMDSAQSSAQATGRPGIGCESLTPGGDVIHIAGPIIERCQMVLTRTTDYASLPRAEITTIIRPQRNAEIDNVPDVSVGRPQIQPNPAAVALYLIHKLKISRSEAQTKYGLSVTEHYRNRDFAIELLKNMKRLRGAV